MAYENIVAIPPDGGWGWVIVAVCFYASAVIDVPAMGFQIILQPLMDTLEISASKASIIFSSYTLLLYFMGPFAGGICNRFGFKITTIVGCLLMIAGFVVSYFINDFIAFTIFFGIIGGLGSSLIFMVGNVAPGYWFEVKRAIALGIASSSTGFAVFSVSLTDYVYKKYGWKWCFNLWAACVGILCILAFFLKMPPLVELDGGEMTDEKKKHFTASDVFHGRIKGLRPMRKKKKDEKMKGVADSYGVQLQEPKGAPTRYSGEKKVGSRCARCLRCCFCMGSYEIGARPLYRKDIFYHGSIIRAADIEAMDPKTYRLTVTNLPTQKDVNQEVECSCNCRCPEALVRVVKEMVDFTLFKSPAFLFLVVASLLCYTAIYIPFMLIKKVNLDWKMEEGKAALLTTIMGLGSTFGRSSIGFLLYFFPRIKALQVLILFSIMGGAVICCLPIYRSFYYQATMSFLGGALPAVISPLRSIVIIEMLGLQKLTNASGILFFVQGIGCFIGVPIAELLNEWSGTKYFGLIFSGACYILVGLTFACIALLVVLKNKKANRS